VRTPTPSVTGPATVLLVLLAAGCGASAAPPAAPGRTAAAVAGNLCPESALQVSLDDNAAGVAAGSSYVPLDFRNISASACTLPGSLAVSFASGLTGPAIGAPAVRQQQSSARPLSLGPGLVAHAWLQIQDVASYPQASCKPATARGLRIGFGTGSADTFVARTIATCASAPSGSQILAVYPVQAGQARPGTAP
jgi:hypothetical protein